MIFILEFALKKSNIQDGDARRILEGGFSSTSHDLNHLDKKEADSKAVDALMVHHTVEERIWNNECFVAHSTSEGIR
jgi:hypothetical protein